MFFNENQSFWQQRQLAFNQFQGKVAENRAENLGRMFRGNEMERVNTGADFRETKRSNIINCPKGINNVEGSWDIEVKNGRSKLSKRQLKNKKDKGEGFREERYGF